MNYVAEDGVGVVVDMVVRTHVSVKLRVGADVNVNAALNVDACVGVGLGMGASVTLSLLTLMPGASLMLGRLRTKHCIGFEAARGAQRRPAWCVRLGTPRVVKHAACA